MNSNAIKSSISKIVILSSLLSPLGVTLKPWLQNMVPHANAGDFDPNNLISDETFTNIDAMTTGQIQTFLNARGGFLKDFNEGGRSAAQIIFDAAHGYGEASNNNGIPVNGILITAASGTVSPQVILATLQKESGLLTMPNRNDDSLRIAMGYGCPDSGGCNGAYAGFTKQVENGAWQLRYNYARAQGRGFADYQVGQTITAVDFNGIHTATFSNRATASLYRYTPHVYNGNYNFWSLMNLYFSSPTARWAGQSGNPTIFPGQSAAMQVSFLNTSNRTWYRTGATPLHLALNKDKDEATGKRFKAADWPASDRVALMDQATVPPGLTATFNFNVTMPIGMTPGDYQFYVRLVFEGEQWFGDEFGAWWVISAPNYSARWAGQSGITTLSPGQDTTLSASFLNTSATAWNATGTGAVHLAINKDKEEATGKQFAHGSWLASDRPSVLASNVAPGQVGNFNFPIHVPTTMSPGTYKLYVRLVSENYTWFSDANGAWWPVTVAYPSASYVGQSGTMDVARGATASGLVIFKNTGSTTWKNNGDGPINLAVDNQKNENVSKQFYHASWISSDRVARIPGDIAPGETVTIPFTIAVPTSLAPGSYQFYVRLVAENVTWLANGAWWQINVQ